MILKAVKISVEKNVFQNALHNLFANLLDIIKEKLIGVRLVIKTIRRFLLINSKKMEVNTSKL